MAGRSLSLLVAVAIVVAAASVAALGQPSPLLRYQRNTAYYFDFSSDIDLSGTALHAHEPVGRGGHSHKLMGEVVVAIDQVDEAQRLYHCRLLIPSMDYQVTRSTGGRVNLPGTGTNDFRRPFYFSQSFEGEIVDVKFPSDETEAMVNIKKGIVNLFHGKFLNGNGQQQQQQEQQQEDEGSYRYRDTRSELSGSRALFHYEVSSHDDAVTAGAPRGARVVRVVKTRAPASEQPNAADIEHRRKHVHTLTFDVDTGALQSVTTDELIHIGSSDVELAASRPLSEAPPKQDGSVLEEEDVHAGVRQLDNQQMRLRRHMSGKTSQYEIMDDGAKDDITTPGAFPNHVVLSKAKTALRLRQAVDLALFASDAEKVDAAVGADIPNGWSTARFQLASTSLHPETSSSSSSPSRRASRSVDVTVTLTSDTLHFRLDAHRNEGGVTATAAAKNPKKFLSTIEELTACVVEYDQLTEDLVVEVAKADVTKPQLEEKNELLAQYKETARSCYAKLKNSVQKAYPPQLAALVAEVDGAVVDVRPWMAVTLAERQQLTLIDALMSCGTDDCQDVLEHVAFGARPGEVFHLNVVWNAVDSFAHVPHPSLSAADAVAEIYFGMTQCDDDTATMDDDQTEEAAACNAFPADKREDALLVLGALCYNMFVVNCPQETMVAAEETNEFDSREPLSDEQAERCARVGELVALMEEEVMEAIGRRGFRHAPLTNPEDTTPTYETNHATIHVLHAIGNAGHPQSVELLRGFITAHPHAAVRKTAVHALRRTPSTKAEVLLSDALLNVATPDEDDHAQEAAMRAWHVRPRRADTEHALLVGRFVDALKQHNQPSMDEVSYHRHLRRQLDEDPALTRDQKEEWSSEVAKALAFAKYHPDDFAARHRQKRCEDVGQSDPDDYATCEGDAETGGATAEGVDQGTKLAALAPTLNVTLQLPGFFYELKFGPDDAGVKASAKVQNKIELLLNPLKSRLTADVDNEGGIWLSVFGKDITVFSAQAIYKAFIGYNLDALSFDPGAALKAMTEFWDKATQFVEDDLPEIDSNMQVWKDDLSAQTDGAVLEVGDVGGVTALSADVDEWGEELEAHPAAPGKRRERGLDTRAIMSMFDSDSFDVSDYYYADEADEFVLSLADDDVLAFEDWLEEYVIELKLELQGMFQDQIELMEDLGLAEGEGDAEGDGLLSSMEQAKDLVGDAPQLIKDAIDCLLESPLASISKVNQAIDNIQDAVGLLVDDVIGSLDLLAIPGSGFNGKPTFLDIDPEMRVLTSLNHTFVLLERVKDEVETRGLTSPYARRLAREVGADGTAHQRWTRDENLPASGWAEAQITCFGDDCDDEGDVSYTRRLMDDIGIDVSMPTWYKEFLYSKIKFSQWLTDILCDVKVFLDKAKRIKNKVQRIQKFVGRIFGTTFSKKFPGENLIRQCSDTCGCGTWPFEGGYGADTAKMPPMDRGIQLAQAPGDFVYMPVNGGISGYRDVQDDPEWKAANSVERGVVHEVTIIKKKKEYVLTGVKLTSEALKVFNDDVKANIGIHNKKSKKWTKTKAGTRIGSVESTINLCQEKDANGEFKPPADMQNFMHVTVRDAFKYTKTRYYNPTSMLYTFPDLFLEFLETENRLYLEVALVVKVNRKLLGGGAKKKPKDKKAGEDDSSSVQRPTRSLSELELSPRQPRHLFPAADNKRAATGGMARYKRNPEANCEIEFSEDDDDTCKASTGEIFRRRVDVLNLQLRFQAGPVPLAVRLVVGVEFTISYLANLCPPTMTMEVGVIPGLALLVNLEVGIALGPIFGGVGIELAVVDQKLIPRAVISMNPQPDLNACFKIDYVLLPLSWRCYLIIEFDIGIVVEREELQLFGGGLDPWRKSMLDNCEDPPRGGKPGEDPPPRGTPVPASNIYDLIMSQVAGLDVAEPEIELEYAVDTESSPNGVTKLGLGAFPRSTGLWPAFENAKSPSEFVNIDADSYPWLWWQGVFYGTVEHVNGDGVFSVGTVGPLIVDRSGPELKRLQDGGTFDWKGRHVDKFFWNDRHNYEFFLSMAEEESEFDRCYISLGGGGQPDIVDWQLLPINETDTHEFSHVISFTDLNFTLGDQVFASVMCNNTIGIEMPPQYTDGVIVDFTPPYKAAGVFDGHTTGVQHVYQPYNTYLVANWPTPDDDESGIHDFTMSGRRADNNVEVAFDHRGKQKLGVLADLDLEDGTYYVEVVATNYADLSTTMQSVGIIVDLSPPVVDGVLSYDRATEVTTLTLTVSDPHSSVFGVAVGIGRVHGQDDLLPFRVLFQANETAGIPAVKSYSFDATILNAPLDTYFTATVWSRNGAGLLGEGFSNSLIIDTTPPETDLAEVGDGPLLAVDIDAQASLDTLSATWHGFVDRESLITRYFAAAGTTPGATDLADFVDVGEDHAVTFSGLSLVHQGTYYVSVYAKNEVDLVSAVVSSDGVTVDATAPDSSLASTWHVSDVTPFQTTATEARAAFNGFSDPESGVASYEARILHVANDVEAGPRIALLADAETLVFGDITLETGVQYRIGVTAENGVGLVSGVVWSGTFIADVDPPLQDYFCNGDNVTVCADGVVEYSTVNTELDVSWHFTDPESGVITYEYAVQSLLTSTSDQLRWIPTPVEDAKTLSLDRTSDPLVNGDTYYIYVRATNGAQLQVEKRSPGVLVDITPPSIGVVSDGQSGLDVDLQEDASFVAATWRGFTDPESGVVGYEWRLLLSPAGGGGPAEVVGWQQVGADQHSIRIEDNTLAGALLSSPLLGPFNQYSFEVRATNNAGLTSSAGASDGVALVTGIYETGTVSDGPGSTDISVQIDRFSLTARWEGFLDRLNGIGAMQWFVGSSPGATDISPPSEFGVMLDRHHRAGGSQLLDGSDGVVHSFQNLETGGQVYYVGVHAVSRGGRGLTAVSDGVSLDISPPVASLGVTGAGVISFSTLPTFLDDLTWAAADVEVGLSSILYGLGSHPGAVDILSFTSLAADSSSFPEAYTPPARGMPIFVTVLVENTLSMTRLLSSSLLSQTLDDTAPLGGTVTLGFTPGRHSGDAPAASIAWSEFIDVESPITGFYVSLGTSPGADNTVSRWFVPATALEHGVTLDSSRTSSVVVDGSTEYFASVEAVNAAGLLSTSASSPSTVVAVASSPPIPGMTRVSTDPACVDCSSTDDNLVDVALSLGRDGAHYVQKCNFAVTVDWSQFHSDSKDDIKYTFSIGTMLNPTMARARGPSNYEVTQRPSSEIPGVAIYRTTISGMTLLPNVQYHVFVYGVSSSSPHHPAASVSNVVRIARGVPPLQAITVIDAQPRPDHMEPVHVPGLSSTQLRGAELVYHRLTDSIEFEWTYAVSAMYGALTYTVEYAVGSTPGETDVTGGFVVSGNNIAYGRALAVGSFVQGKAYWITVRVSDSAGNSREDVSVAILIDADAPVPGTVFDGPMPLVDVDKLLVFESFAASWNGFHDPASGLSHYEVALSLSPDAEEADGANLVVPFFSVGLDRSVLFENVRLDIENTLYFVAVRAVNGAGDSVVAVSDGFNVVANPPSTGRARIVIEGEQLKDNLLYDPFEGRGASLVRFTSRNEVVEIEWDTFTDQVAGVLGLTHFHLEVYSWPVGESVNESSTAPAGTLVGSLTVPANVSRAFVPLDSDGTGTVVADGSRLYAHVVAENYATLLSEPAVTGHVFVDASPPPMTGASITLYPLVLSSSHVGDGITHTSPVWQHEATAISVGVDGFSDAHSGIGGFVWTALYYDECGDTVTLPALPETVAPSVDALPNDSNVVFDWEYVPYSSAVATESTANATVNGGSIGHPISAYVTREGLDLVPGRFIVIFMTAYNGAGVMADTLVRTTDMLGVDPTRPTRGGVFVTTALDVVQDIEAGTSQVATPPIASYSSSNEAISFFWSYRYPRSSFGATASDDGTCVPSTNVSLVDSEGEEWAAFDNTAQVLAYYTAEYDGANDENPALYGSIIAGEKNATYVGQPLHVKDKDHPLYGVEDVSAPSTPRVAYISDRVLLLESEIRLTSDSSSAGEIRFPPAPGEGDALPSLLSHRLAGEYSVTMQAVEADGYVTSFMLVVPEEGTEQHAVHDFDIVGSSRTAVMFQIFGNDPTHAHVRYTQVLTGDADDTNDDNAIINLGFNAAEAPHTYGMHVSKAGGDIYWSIDGAIVAIHVEAAPLKPCLFLVHVWSNARYGVFDNANSAVVTTADNTEDMTQVRHQQHVDSVVGEPLASVQAVVSGLVLPPTVSVEDGVGLVDFCIANEDNVESVLTNDLDTGGVFADPESHVVSFECSIGDGFSGDLEAYLPFTPIDPTLFCHACGSLTDCTSGSVDGADACDAVCPEDTLGTLTFTIDSLNLPWTYTTNETVIVTPTANNTNDLPTNTTTEVVVQAVEKTTSYTVSLRAINSAGLASKVATSELVTLDPTPPTLEDLSPTSVFEYRNRGVGEKADTPKRYQTDTHRLAAFWEFKDAESGIASYRIAFGTVADGVESVLPFTGVVSPTSGLSSRYITKPLVAQLEHGKQYHATVEATNHAGLVTQATSTVSMTIDTTPPIGGRVTVNRYQTSRSRIFFSFADFEDPESGVVFYDVAVTTMGSSAGTSSSNGDTSTVLATQDSVGGERRRSVENGGGYITDEDPTVMPFTWVPIEEEGTHTFEREELLLELGRTYYAVVRAWNAANSYTEVTTHGITLITETDNVISLKDASPDGTNVEVGLGDTTDFALSVNLPSVLPEAADTIVIRYLDDEEIKSLAFSDAELTQAVDPLNVDPAQYEDDQEFRFLGLTFTVTMYDSNGVDLDATNFLPPVMVTVRYDSVFELVGEEMSLEYFDVTTGIWVRSLDGCLDAGLSPDDATPVVDSELGTITYPVCHFTQFSMNARNIDESLGGGGGAGSSSYSYASFSAAAGGAHGRRPARTATFFSLIVTLMALALPLVLARSSSSSEAVTPSRGVGALRLSLVLGVVVLLSMASTASSHALRPSGSISSLLPHNDIHELPSLTTTSSSSSSAGVASVVKRDVQEGAALLECEVYEVIVEERASNGEKIRSCQCDTTKLMDGYCVRSRQARMAAGDAAWAEFERLPQVSNDPVQSKALESYWNICWNSCGFELPRALAGSFSTDIFGGAGPTPGKDVVGVSHKTAAYCAAGRLAVTLALEQVPGGEKARYAMVKYEACRSFLSVLGDDQPWFDPYRNPQKPGATRVSLDAPEPRKQPKLAFYSGAWGRKELINRGFTPTDGTQSGKIILVAARKTFRDLTASGKFKPVIGSGFKEKQFNFITKMYHERMASSAYGKVTVFVSAVDLIWQPTGYGRKAVLGRKQFKAPEKTFWDEEFKHIYANPTVTSINFVVQKKPTGNPLLEALPINCEELLERARKKAKKGNKSRIKKYIAKTSKLSNWLTNGAMGLIGRKYKTFYKEYTERCPIVKAEQIQDSVGPFLKCTQETT